MATADDTAPIELATGRRLDTRPPASEPDAPERRKHDTSNALALALIDRFDSLIRANLHSGIPAEVKEALAAEAVRMVERAWTSRADERATETQTAMRMPPDHAPRQARASRAWPILAGVLAFVILLGSVASLASVFSLRLDAIQGDYDELAEDAKERAAAMDARLGQLTTETAEDAAYNRVVANWLVGHVNTTNDNARNLDSMMRAIAGRVKADVSGISPPIKEYLPTEVNKMSAAHEYLDDK